MCSSRISCTVRATMTLWLRFIFSAAAFLQRCNFVRRRFFTKNASVFNPIKISTNQQFVHLGVVCVFHCHGFCLQAVPLSECANFVGVIVSHQKITAQLFANRKKAFVIYFRVRIKPRTGALAAGGVWRVNKEHCFALLLKTRKHIESIAVNKFKTVGNEFDVCDALGNRLRIPAGQNSFSVLAVFQYARAFR